MTLDRHPTERDVLLDRLIEREEIRAALEAWKIVRGLVASGTPAEGIGIIAQYNVDGLRKLLGED